MMSWHREPTLEEILADPITKAVMRADSVDLEELETLLRKLAVRSRAARKAGKERTAEVFQ
jgi:hypothetical protein